MQGLRACMGVGCFLLSSCSQREPVRSQTSLLLPCPEQDISTEDAEALGRAGYAAVNKNRMGDHHSTESLNTGIPMLKKAALHGDSVSMSRYSSLVIWYGFIDNDGTPFLGRSQWQNALEGVLFMTLAAHRDASNVGDDAETFRVLLDPSIPYPHGFFEDGSGAAGLLDNWTPDDLDPIRQQAYRWKDCWTATP